MVILSTCPRSSERRLVICPCIVVLLTSFLRSAFSLFNIAWVLTRTVTKALASWDVYRGLAMKGRKRKNAFPENFRPTWSERNGMSCERVHRM